MLYAFAPLSICSCLVFIVLKKVRGFGAENCTFPGKKRAKFLKTSK